MNERNDSNSGHHSAEYQNGGNPGGAGPVGSRNRPEDMYRLRLEKTAFFMGAVSIPCTFIWPLMMPCLLGSMAIVLAIISKGGSLKMSSQGRAAVVLGIVGIVMNVFYLGIALKTMQTMLTEPDGRQYLNDLLYQQYGMTLEELFSKFPSLQ
ncbi:MAG: hypothetical protein Q4C02_00275 [Eubacteriales bacterium]|nr:hypothetical protein [Lachnospiraceae bacterium]MDO4416698.1 hypothetical protein [Eubacteriales bacterium]